MHLTCGILLDVAIVIFAIRAAAGPDEVGKVLGDKAQQVSIEKLTAVVGMEFV